MSEVTNTLTDIPLGHIVGSPLKSAVEAQALAAQATVEFIKQVGFKPVTPGTNSDLIDEASASTNLGSVRQVVFKYTRQGETALETVELSIPILSIIPIPYIRVEEIETDFTIKITETNSFTSRTGTQTGLRRSAEWGAPHYGFKAAYARRTQRLSERQNYVDTSATMKVRIKAVQDELPSGIARILDIMEDSLNQKIS